MATSNDNSRTSSNGSSIGSDAQSHPPSSVEATRTRSNEREQTQVQQEEHSLASASTLTAAEAAGATRSENGPELVNDTSCPPLPAGMIEGRLAQGQGEGEGGFAANTRCESRVSTSSIVMKVRRFENEMKRRQLELADETSPPLPDTEIFAAHERMIDENEAAGMVTAGRGMSKKSIMRKPEVIEDDESAPLPILLDADELNNGKKGVENTKKKPKKPAAVESSVQADTQSHSQVSQSRPNQARGNHETNSNTVQNNDRDAQNQESTTRPLPASSDNNDGSSDPPLLEARLVVEEPSPPVYNATIVRTNNSDIEEGHQNDTLASAEEEEKPWWKNQRYVIFGIVLVSCVTVGVLVTLLVSRGSGRDGETANNDNSDSGSSILKDGTEPTKSPTVLLDSNNNAVEDQTNNSGLFDSPNGENSAMPLDSNSTLIEAIVETTTTSSVTNTAATTSMTTSTATSTTTTATNVEMVFESGGDPIAGYEYVGEGTCIKSPVYELGSSPSSTDLAGISYQFISTLSVPDAAACGASCSRFSPVGEAFRGFNWFKSEKGCWCYFDANSDLEGIRSTYGSDTDEVPGAASYAKGSIGTHSFSEGRYCYRVVTATVAELFEFLFEDWIVPERPTATTSSMTWKQQGQGIIGKVDSLSFSANGMILAVGEAAKYDGSGHPTSSGQVKVFGWDETSLDYKQIGDIYHGNDHRKKGRELLHKNGNFGLTVSLSGNGKVVAAGGYENNVGYVMVYGWDGSYYRQLGKSIFDETNLEFEFDGFGSSIALSADGQTLAIAAYGPVRGAYVRVYRWDDATFNYMQLGDTLTNDGDKYDEFGWSLSLSANGDTLAVGSRGSASKVDVYGWDGDTLTYNQLGDSLSTGDEYDAFGHSLSLSANGEKLAVGTPTSRVHNSTGFVTIYVWDGDTSNYKVLESANKEDAASNNWWEGALVGKQQHGTLFGDAENDYFGSSVSLSADGKVLVAGAHQRCCKSLKDNGGYVRLYSWDDTSLSYKKLHDLHGEAGDSVGAFVSLSADGMSLATVGYGANDYTFFGKVKLFTLVAAQNSEEGLLSIENAATTSSTTTSLMATPAGAAIESTFDSPPPCFQERAFQDKAELQAAVNEYILQDCSDNSECVVGQTYGWPMNSWCVGNVTDMSDLLSNKGDFNEDLFNWDVSRVTNMESMFHKVYSFMGDISSWDVSNVTNMKGMFTLSHFNANIGYWDVSSVTNMDHMFWGAPSFNQDISSWNISSVRTMKRMFKNANSFNQDLCSWGDKFPYGDFVHIHTDCPVWGSDCEIFSGSSCTFQDTPKLAQRGPFCASTCN